jgi:hypothetical protein
MFDRIMENTMALWLSVSAAYLFFMAGIIVKSIRHFRRSRGVLAYPTGPRRASASAPGRAYATATELSGAEPRDGDWSPAR